MLRPEAVLASDMRERSLLPPVGHKPVLDTRTSTASLCIGLRQQLPMPEAARRSLIADADILLSELPDFEFCWEQTLVSKAGSTPFGL